MKTRLIGTAAIAAALALAGCASTSPGYGSGYGSAPQSGYGSSCYDCGTVTRIERTNDGKPNIAGPLLGGVVGAVAGKELARRNTDSEGRRNVATAGGAIAGAVAGNAIQNRVEGSGTYNVHVRMDDGRTMVLSQAEIGGLREGSYVRVQNGRAYAR
ncbi:glycine zipper 2TM domain-containing protein [Luteimonas sp. RD2P54]|uniref:Glycine zipper 2TM domain-containing protein n=1 Tax=Luteimonas endophytica TaxID=3042023 RepID=A0ABT6JC23_9GAMM|nr:glycine zipper 2TM domain-containing protein [Luteimonas endophytica]MDH5824381.1 glycine zipper 2TM domain-containing protein [Luteimonas endophytica]